MLNLSNLTLRNNHFAGIPSFAAIEEENGVKLELEKDSGGHWLELGRAHHWR